MTSAHTGSCSGKLQLLDVAAMSSRTLTLRSRTTARRKTHAQWCTAWCRIDSGTTSYGDPLSVTLGNWGTLEKMVSPAHVDSRLSEVYRNKVNFRETYRNGSKEQLNFTYINSESEIMYPENLEEPDGVEEPDEERNLETKQMIS